MGCNTETLELWKVFQGDARWWDFWGGYLPQLVWPSSNNRKATGGYNDE
jgi:hypothetical protein